MTMRAGAFAAKSGTGLLGVQREQRFVIVGIAN